MYLVLGLQTILAFYDQQVDLSFINLEEFIHPVLQCQCSSQFTVINQYHVWYAKILQIIHMQARGLTAKFHVNNFMM